jgi:hypothetical protein
MKALPLFLLLLSVSLLHAAQCSRVGESLASEGWSASLRRVCLTEAFTENTFRSPDGQKTIVADQNGFTLRIRDKKVAWPDGQKMSPNGSEVSWSPTSSAFFINYGDGSGLDGWTIDVVSTRDDRVTDHKEINERIVHLFREHINCSKEAADPNVRGLGWSKDGTHLFAFAQATVSEACGTQGDSRGVVVSLATGAVSQEAKRHLHDLLPYNMR